MLKINTIHKVLLSSIFVSLLSLEVIAQCTVQAYASSYDITCGDMVQLTAVGDGEIVFENDFDDCTIGTGWETTSAADFTDPCGYSPNGTCYLWMGNASAAPRNATTSAINLSTGGSICFEMRYASQGNPSPCEGVDLPDEGVSLQFSNPNHNGGNWTDIKYYHPNGGRDPFRTSWNQYCQTIPAEAMGPNVRVRWIQKVSTAEEMDHWGLENVVIKINPPIAQYTWQHTGVTKQTGDTPDVQPTETTTYTVEYFDGSSTCYQDVTINVTPLNVDAQILGTIPICPNTDIKLNAISDLHAEFPQTCGLSSELQCSSLNEQRTRIEIGGGTIEEIGGMSEAEIFGDLYDDQVRSQFIFKASELIAAGFIGGRISTLEFEILNVLRSDILPDIEIKMTCTDKDEMPNKKFIDGTQLVFARSNFVIKDGWMTFELDNSFNWDGTSNILIEVCVFPPAGSIWGDWSPETHTKNHDPGFRSLLIATPGSSYTSSGSCEFSYGTYVREQIRPNTRFSFCSPKDVNITYNWTPDASLDDKTLQKPTATPPSTTTYTVALNVAGYPQGCEVKDSVEVTVSDIGNFTPTFNPVCEGGDLKLRAKINGMDSYNWTGPNGFTSTQKNPEIIGVSKAVHEGVYELTVNDGNCNVTKTVTVTIDEPSNPGVPSNITICYSSPEFNLFDQITGEDKGGEWRDTDLSGGIKNDSIFDPGKIPSNKIPGTFTVTYAVRNNSCPEETTDIEITVNASPSAGLNNDTLFCESNCTPVNLYDCLLGSPNTGGVWTDLDGSGALSGSVLTPCNITSTGFYRFEYKIPGAAPCGDATSIVTVEIEGVSNPGVASDIDLCYSSSPINLYNQLTGNDRKGGWRSISMCGGLEKDSIFNPSKLNVNTLPTTCTVEYYTPINLRACPQQSVPVNIKVGESPSAGSDSSATLCQTIGTVDLFDYLKGSPDIGGSWTDASNSSISPNQNLSKLTPGEHCFRYTVASTPPCPDAKAQVCITVEEQYEAGTGIATSICIGNQIDLTQKLTGSNSNAGTWENHLNPNTSEVVLTDPLVSISNNQNIQGEFIFRYVVAPDSVCSADTAFVPVTINSYPAIGSAIITCAPDKLTWDIEIELEGGDTSTYNVTPSGSITQATYTQTGNPNASTVNFTITDANGCGSIDTTFTKNCACVTQVGTMDNINDTLKACLNNSVTALYAGGFVNDGNDTLSYVLHNGSLNQLGNNVYAKSETPTFYFDASTGMQTGIVYYISAVAGDDLNSDGIADGTDDCFDVAFGQPIVFYDYPQASISATPTTICPGQIVVSTINISKGISPFRTVVNGVSTTQSQNSLDSTYTNIISDYNIELDSIIDATGCGIAINQTIPISVDVAPIAQIINATQGCPGSTFEVQVSSNDPSATLFNFSYTDNLSNDTINIVNQPPSIVVVTPTSSDPNTIVSYSLTAVSDNTGSICPGGFTGKFDLYPTPTASVTSLSNVFCVTDNIPLNFSLTGIGPWEVLLDSNGTPYDTLQLNTPSASHTIPSATFSPGNHTIDIREIIDKAPGSPNCNNISPNASFNFSILSGSQAAVSAVSSNYCDGDDIQLDFNMTFGDAGATYNIAYDIINTNTADTISGNNINVTEGIGYTVTHEDLTPGIYKVDITKVESSGSGCPGIGIDLMPAFEIHPRPTATPNTTVYNECVSNTALIIPFSTTGTGIISFDVVDQNSLPLGSYNSNSSSFTVPRNNEGTFTYTLTNVVDGSAASCVGTGGNFSVNVIPIPTINFNQSQDGNDEFVFCEGNSQEVAFTTTGSGILTTSTPNGEFVTNHIDSEGSYQNIALNSLAAGTHTINVNILDNSPASCTSNTQFTVKVQPNPSASIDFSGLNLCENGTYNNVPIINITGGSTNFDLLLYNELSGAQLDDTLNISAGADVTLDIGQIEQNGLATFRLTVNDYTIDETGNVCTFSGLFSATVYKQPIAEINVLSPSICDGEEAIIVVEAYNSDGNQFFYSYNENGVNQQTMKPFSPNTDTIRFIPAPLNYGSSPQQYVYDLIHLEDNKGCLANIIKPTDYLNVNPAPHVGFIEDTLVGCSPLTIEFRDTTNRNLPDSPITSLFWDFGNGEINTDTTSFFEYTYYNDQAVDKTYNVTLSAINNHGCDANRTKTVIVYPNPDPYFIMNPDNLDVMNNQAVFYNQTSVDITSNIWVINNDTILTSETPDDLIYTFEPIPNTQHRICLDATSINQCKAQYCIKTMIDDKVVIYIPNSFSPNDDEANQVFKPIITSGLNLETYTFIIYDRWGQIVFETNDVHKGWNGRNKNNEVVPTGVYVYFVQGWGDIVPIRKITKTGHVNLIK